ncbi:MAG TPA: GNAT family N-acetyltransferase [Candidatus Limnocylindrales bacterium]
MRVIPYGDITEYLRDVTPFLEREPVRHNLIATLLAARSGTASGTGSGSDTGTSSGTATSSGSGSGRADGLLLWRVVDGSGSTLGLAVVSPPPLPTHITDLPPGAAEAVAAQARIHGVERFYGPGSRRLAELAAAGTAPITRISGSGLHLLRRVTPPEGVSGHARLATPDELDTLFEWVGEFQREVGDDEPMERSNIEQRIERGGMWVWEDHGRAVSMAAWTVPANGATRINLVYTPRWRRGRGYASALVAAISQAILDQGNIPLLYTDLANPTSNKIYAAVGFEKIAEPEFWEIFRGVPEEAVPPVNNLAVRWAQTLDPQRSTAYSPASVWPLLALLAGAADPSDPSGTAHAELAEAVGLAGDHRRIALDLLAALDHIPEVRAALGVWVRAGLPLTPEWADARVLSGQAELDEWARTRTRGKIERMPVTIDDETLLLLACALNVQTYWRQPFDVFRDTLYRYSTDLDSVAVIDTPSGPLTRVRIEGTREVDVYLVAGNLAGGNLAAGIRSLSGEYPQTLGSALLESGGSGPGVSATSAPAFDPTPEVHLATVKFTVQSGHDLLENAVLFGLSAATDRSRGHFPGISPFPLAISAARQETVATFSATGFESASVTAMGAVVGGIPPQTKPVLKVDVRPPFGFLAVHRPSGLLLTAGWIADDGGQS